MAIDLEPLYKACKELKESMAKAKEGCDCNLRDNSEQKFWLICERKDNGLIEPEPGKTVFLNYPEARKHALKTGKLIHEVVFKQVDTAPRVIDPEKE